jgi:CTP synthase (UTP-ammonia lyase)
MSSAKGGLVNMKRSINIAVIGDFNPENRSHINTNHALGHVENRLGINVNVEWAPTPELQDAEAASKVLDKYSGVWGSPGSPYRSMEGALNGIRFAREMGVPFIGTCGGFQHAIIEYARNVLGYSEADHEESNPYASELFVSKLVCSVFDKTLTVNLKAGSRARTLVGKDQINEHYYCNFGVNPDYKELIDQGGLRVTGVDPDGEARVIELPDHRFFIGTLFLPQDSSTAEAPHPLIISFVEAAANFKAEEGHLSAPA